MSFVLAILLCPILDFSPSKWQNLEDITEYNYLAHGSRESICGKLTLCNSVSKLEQISLGLIKVAKAFHALPGERDGFPKEKVQYMRSKRFKRRMAMEWFASEPILTLNTTVVRCPVMVSPVPDGLQLTYSPSHPENNISSQA